MTNDDNVIPVNFTSPSGEAIDEDIEVLYRSSDEVLLESAARDAIVDVGVTGEWHALFGPTVRLGDYLGSPGEMRWVASQLAKAADVVDPEHESVLHTKAQVEAEAARLFGIRPREGA